MKYIHHRIGPKGGATFAFELVSWQDGRLTANYAVAKCSHKDNYNKKLGREIAMGRMLKKKFKTILVDPSNVVQDIVYDYANDEKILCV